MGVPEEWLIRSEAVGNLLGGQQTDNWFFFNFKIYPLFKASGSFSIILIKT